MKGHLDIYHWVSNIQCETLSLDHVQRVISFIRNCTTFWYELICTVQFSTGQLVCVENYQVMFRFSLFQWTLDRNKVVCSKISAETKHSSPPPPPPLAMSILRKRSMLEQHISRHISRGQHGTWSTSSLEELLANLKGYSCSDTMLENYFTQTRFVSFYRMLIGLVLSGRKSLLSHGIDKMRFICHVHGNVSQRQGWFQFQ